MEQKKLLVISNNYPSESNIYANAFIHSRIVHYTKTFDIRVLVFNKNKEDRTYQHEHIFVQVTNDKKHFKHYLELYKPDIIAIHFVEAWMFDSFIKNFTNPIYIWVHGVEALGWYRRLFNFNINNLKEFLAYIKNNTLQLVGLRRIIRHSNLSGQIKFIFVSNWMKHITEHDTLSKIKYAEIIPNPIDTSKFQYAPKGKEKRKRILLIRPFDSRKYANDLAIKAILELSKRPFFKDIEISIYGKGKFFIPLTNQIKDFPNVYITHGFVEHNRIPAIHQQHGIFLCPTRQDAQGVSMCEAMSSGLVVVTSNNTAIPEFVEDNNTGLFANTPKEIADKIELLYYHPELFAYISQNASTHIRTIAGHRIIIQRELALLTSKTD